MNRKTAVLSILSGICVLSGLAFELGFITYREPRLSFLLPMGVVLAGAALMTRLFECEAQVAVHDQEDALQRVGQTIPESETPAKQGSILSK